MNCKIYTLDEIRKLITPALKAHKVRKALVFGSYSKGCAEGKSDIDILVDSDLHGLEFVDLIEDIREALDKDVDVISTRQIDKGTPIESEIYKYGVVVYEE